MRLSQYILEKNDFDGVSMIRLIYKEKYYDYSKWKISGQNIFFYDDNLKVTHILWTTDPIEVVDDVRIIIGHDNNKHKIALELFYGGAILNG